MVESQGRGVDKGELLISKWFPITEVSVESVRERTPGTDFSPLSRIHVWFARRPLTTSRATVALSLLPSNVNREVVLQLLGIPIGVNLRKAEEEIVKAKAAGIRLKYNPFSWSKAYRYTPSEDELAVVHSRLQQLWGVERPLVVDPMAGGGAIPFEAMRLGLPVVAGDLNPVAFLCLKGTLEYPAKFGKKLVSVVEDFCKTIHKAAKDELEESFPKQSGEKVYAYLWARTVKCSSCGLTIPLSPNWWIIRTGKDRDNVAAKILVPKVGDKCSFEIIKNPVSHGLDPYVGTVKGGRAECPRCHMVTAGDEVKREAQNGRMRHQLYAVCVKNRGVRKKRAKWNFRTPSREEHEAIEKAERRLNEKLSKWESHDLVPNEEYVKGFSDRCSVYGVGKWSDLFNPRQLLTHLTYLEKFQQAKEKLFAGKQRGSKEWDFATAIVSYGSIVFDTSISYSCLISRWDSTRKKICNALELQAFPFKWSYAEWDHSQMLWPWALSKVLDALGEIIDLLPENPSEPTVYCGTAKDSVKR